jgi:SAM-dependent methyltransferase
MCTVKPLPQPDPYDVLDELYDEWIVSVVEDVGFYTSLAAELTPESGAPLTILEIGAGSGRISIPLALRGHHVIGIDTSEAQLSRLARARASAELPEDAVTAVHADMRTFRTDPPVDLVIAPFRSLLHAADEPVSLLKNLRRSLKPGGTLAFDVFHPTVEQQAEAEWTLRRRVDLDTGSWAIWERAHFHNDTPRVDLDVRCEWSPAAASAAAEQPFPTVPGQRLAQMTLWLPGVHEWSAALDEAGFDVVSAYGWFDERRLDAVSADSIWVARARG